MLKKVTAILMAGIMFGAFISCSDIEEESKSERKSSCTPYSTKETLIEYKNNGFVDYRVSKYYAVSALEDFAEENSWENAKLSEYPIVIFNATTNEPKYYEYRVIKDGNEVGAIACSAKKNEGMPVQFVLPFANEITEENSRAIKENSLKIIDKNYPSKITFDSFSRSVNSEIEENLTLDKFLEIASDKELSELGINEESKKELLDEYKKNKMEIEETWNEIDKVTEDIISLSDKELYDIYFSEDENSRALLQNEYSVIDKFYLDNWYDKRNLATNGWCGPNCITFVLLGLNIPYTSASDLYKKVEDEIGTGAKVFSSLSSGLSKFSDYKLDTCVHYWDTIFSHIKNKKLPVISLRSSKGLSKSSIQFHYRTVIGTKTEKVKTVLKIFGKKKTLLSWHDHFYYMHDNGTDGENFYENSKHLYEISAAKVIHK